MSSAEAEEAQSSLNFKLKWSNDSRPDKTTKLQRNMLMHEACVHKQRCNMLASALSFWETCKSMAGKFTHMQAQGCFLFMQINRTFDLPSFPRKFRPGAFRSWVPHDHVSRGR